MEEKETILVKLQKKMGVAILIPYKVDFRTWAITKNEEDHLKMIKE